jgi:hypothetical protein
MRSIPGNGSVRRVGIGLSLFLLAIMALHDAHGQ